jgi:hypothetical protein
VRFDYAKAGIKAAVASTDEPLYCRPWHLRTTQDMADPSVVAKAWPNIYHLSLQGTSQSDCLERPRT